MFLRTSASPRLRVMVFVACDLSPNLLKFGTLNPRYVMTIRWLLAALHLLALGIGLGAVWARSRALRQSLDPAGLARVFAADAWWGVAALLWLSTGLIRLFSSLEKGTAYYFGNRFFLLKMALFIAIILLELAPMMTLGRWRKAARISEVPDTTRAPALARTSVVQAVLIVAMVFAATAMARGLGAS